MTSLQLLENFSRLRVLVVGDIMLDHYVWGDVSRISPEAPVPVVLVERDSYTAGGAANVAHNLSSLGLSVELIGIVGDDEAGRCLRCLLAEKNVTAARCVVSSNAPTIVKTRVMARKQQVCRIDREGPRAHYIQEAESGMLAQVHTAMDEGVQAVIVSDYAKGAISQGVLDGILQAARARQILVAVDPKPERRLTMRGVGLLTPNRHEALELAGLPEPVAGESYPLAAVCARIHENYTPAMLVVTLGADGMALSRGGRVEQVIPTAAREVYDVSGAGDTVIATLTAALAAGADLEKAVHLANQAAGVVVSKIGTAVVTPEELQRQVVITETR
jgi:D-glycero-beta-D-manno-heptose-7-phosphate kinase